MRGFKDYINLTNGLAVLPFTSKPGFIRIQSTHCEQKLWATILQELDSDFLLHVALGYEVWVYDASPNPPSRAIWQGLELIKFVLNKLWLDRDYIPIGRAKSSQKYFTEVYYKLPQRLKAKIKYFRKFLMVDTLHIYGCCYYTAHDGNYTYFKRLLKLEV